VSTTEIAESDALGALPRAGALSANLRRLTDMMLDEEYDEEFLRPTRAAFDTAWSMLVDADISVQEQPILASVAPVGDGGLLLQWERGARDLFLAVPADPQQGYLHLRGPEPPVTLRDLTGPALASAFRWLVNE
jgi:hypothetical protein